MQRRWIVVAALWIVACQTHQIDECLPPCGASDQTFFAECVADGLPGECLAGNRRCCALATECVGDLDDQHVVTTHPDCQFAFEDACYPPCGPEDQREYDLCLATGMTTTGVCPVSDEECCALAVDCLGELGDVIVSADGCCATVDDCHGGERCDPMTFSCVAATGCGDGAVSGAEQCDDGNDFTESCPYGEMMSCLVCGAGCVEQAGELRYCGDETIDASDGEACDPPDLELCDAECRSIGGGGDCFDFAQNGNETDIDCGGDTCDPCDVGSMCLVESDCTAELPECTSACSSAGMCTQCDDGEVCTSDACMPGMGCLPQPLDADFDGFGPLDLGCGEDCDDTRRDVGPSAPEVCDGIDNDCDDLVDETC